MKAFAFKNIPFEVKNSSSGGAFIACCQMFEQQYGIGNVAFCGAELKDDMTVSHDIVYSAKECKRFQGSKYVRSNTNNIYQRVAKLLLQGKAVLFSGTPCQVAALKTVLTNKKVCMDRMLTIDIICHGTPDVRIWETYKTWIEKKTGGKLINYSFRYKPEGWYGYPAYAEFDNGVKLIDTKETSVFSKLHLMGFSITKGCFKCPFSNMKRIGDITLGDFWGIENEQLDIDAGDGVSLVLANTNRGIDIVTGIAQLGTVLPVLGTGYIKNQHNLSCPTEKPQKYDDFWEDMKSCDFDKMLSVYLGYGWAYAVKYNLRNLGKKTGALELYRKVMRKNK
mgnify:CR=1 FL=1